MNRLLTRLRSFLCGAPIRNHTIVRPLVPASDHNVKPIFIIGVYRTGTTLLRFVLDSHPNIAVPPESNFLHALRDIWTTEWYRKGLLGVGVDDEALRTRLQGFVNSMFTDYALARGKSRWADKTPSYVDILEFIDSLYGKNAQYILLYRHGLDATESLQKFYVNMPDGGPARRFMADYASRPKLAFLSYWTHQTKKMLEFERTRTDQTFRIRYEDFSQQPKEYLPPLFAFLGEPWSDEVLEFSKKPHDFGLQDSRILQTRTFEPSLDRYLDWTDQDLRESVQIAGAAMTDLGYSVKGTKTR